MQYSSSQYVAERRDRGASRRSFGSTSPRVLNRPFVNHAPPSRARLQVCDTVSRQSLDSRLGLDQSVESRAGSGRREILATASVPRSSGPSGTSATPPLCTDPRRAEMKRRLSYHAVVPQTGALRLGRDESGGLRWPALPSGHSFFPGERFR